MVPCGTCTEFSERIVASMHDANSPVEIRCLLKIANKFGGVTLGTEVAVLDTFHAKLDAIHKAELEQLQERHRQELIEYAALASLFVDKREESKPLRLVQSSFVERRPDPR